MINQPSFVFFNISLMKCSTKCLRKILLAIHSVIFFIYISYFSLYNFYCLTCVTVYKKFTVFLFISFLIFSSLHFRKRYAEKILPTIRCTSYSITCISLVLLSHLTLFLLISISKKQKTPLADSKNLCAKTLIRI